MSNNSATIESAIAFLRQLVKLEVQHSWQDLELHSIAPLNEKGYFVFPQGKKVKWLEQKIEIPSTLQGYPLQGLSLRLVLTWWAADAQIFINDELVQQGDLFDSSARVLITNNAQPGTEYLVKIRLVSPGHDIGALMRSHLIYEKSDYEQIDPGFVADEIAVLCKYITQFKPQELDKLAAVLQELDRQNLQDLARFEGSLRQLRSHLLPFARDVKQRRFNLLGHAHLDMAWLWTTDETYEVAERTFKSVLNLQQDFPRLTFGHTSPALYQWIEHHRPELFTAIKQAVRANKWEILGGMWIEPETNLVSGESLIRQLIYGQQYYQERFGQMTSVAWLPDSFGFTWQLPQIMQQCGIEYFVTGKLHWNDTTKFPHGCFWWESPDGTRLLTLMSPPNVTGVMDTNPITMIDYAVDWEAQTGLQEMFWLPGVGDHGGGPTRDMLEVAAKWDSSSFFPQIEFGTAKGYLDRLTDRQSQTSQKADAPPGVKRSSPFGADAPLGGAWCESTAADRRLRRLGAKHRPLGQKDIIDAEGVKVAESNNRDFPIWRDELYLELHRGCYTVHADQKRYNRRCERLLYEAELWSTLATLLCGEEFDVRSLCSNLKIKNVISSTEDFSAENLQQLIEFTWQKVLFNQFHDILPGTSISEVFVEANRDWETAIAVGKSLLGHALNTITANIQLPPAPQEDAIPIVVFNSLNWKRSQVVTIEDARFNNPTLDFHLYDENGVKTNQSCHKQENNITFLAENVPGVGYRLFWLCSELACDASNNTTVDSDYESIGRYLKIVVNPNTGDLDSIFDLVNRREILSGQGNELQAFEDKGQYWDAWNIDPDYEQKRLAVTKLESIERLDTVISKVIRVVKTFGRSRFIQDYILEVNSPVLKIVNQVDWQETHVMVKAAFPLNLNSDFVTYEIPCGAIERSTKPETAAEKAQWEVPALNWADLTDTAANHGVSLLNDCKYGYDAQPDCLRLTLLRAATWPDPESDATPRRLQTQGKQKAEPSQSASQTMGQQPRHQDSDLGLHHFTYAIYPHSHSWQKANTVQKGYELNTPLQVIILDRQNRKDSQSARLPTISELLNLSADNLILMALYKSDRDLIMRCYESSGIESNLGIQSDMNLELDRQVDCLGREQLLDKPLNLVQGYKIASFKLRNKSTDKS